MNRYVRAICNPKKVVNYFWVRAVFLFHQIIERHWARIDSERVSRVNGKVLFVDLGANIGQGYTWFKKYFRSNNVYFELFEPNPHCVKKLLRLEDISCGRVKLHPVGVSFKSGSVEFYGTSDDEGGSLSVGGSIVKDHNSNWYRASSSSSIRVDIIDLREYLEARSVNYELIVVKMDIEGAEVELLENMLDDGSIKYIDILYVEFHSQCLDSRLRGEMRKREERILRRLRDHTKTSVRIWH